MLLESLRVILSLCGYSALAASFSRFERRVSILGAEDVRNMSTGLTLAFLEKTLKAFAAAGKPNNVRAWKHSSVFVLSAVLLFF